MAWVGIDVSQANLDVALMAESGQVQTLQVDNTSAGYARLDGWLRKRGAGRSAVTLEATGRYSAGVAQALYEAGYRVSVVNPARIKGYATAQLRRNKTDKRVCQVVCGNEFG